MLRYVTHDASVTATSYIVDTARHALLAVTTVLAEREVGGTVRVLVAATAMVSVVSSTDRPVGGAVWRTGTAWKKRLYLEEF